MPNHSAAKRSKLSTSGITSYKPVVGKRTTPMPPDHPRSDGGKKAARKIPKAVPTPKPTADKSKRKPNKVKPIENDHSKPDKKPKPTAKNPTKSAPKPDVSGGSDIKSRIRATASSKTPTNMRGGRVAAVIAGVAAIAGAIGYYGKKNRDAREARIKERQGKADFAKEKSTLLGPDGNLKPAKKSKYGTPPKKPSRTAPPLKEMGTIKQHPIDKVTGASAAPAPKTLNKPAGTKNTPDMFSQFMSNLTGAKVTPNNSKGPVKHDSNGTTASNQTGGALFGLIKDKKKKGSR